MKRFLILLLLSSPVFAMGRKPDDPATWGDVQNVQSQVTANQQQEQADAAKASDRLDALEGTKYQAEAVVRLYDGKRLTLEEYNNMTLNQSFGPTFGARITFKVGKSYDQRVAEKQQKQIDALTAIINRLEAEKK